MNHESHRRDVIYLSILQCWRVAVRRAHKDPVFLQRRQRQTHYSLARNVSNKAAQQHQISFYFTAFFQLQLLPHTCNMKSHLSPGYSPRTVTMWHHSRDCAWLCCYFISFLLLSSFHALLPFSRSEFAWCDIFQVRGWKIFCRFALWLQSALAQCS